MLRTGKDEGQSQAQGEAEGEAQEEKVSNQGRQPEGSPLPLFLRPEPI
jgi:hypothetical protein